MLGMLVGFLGVLLTGTEAALGTFPSKLQVGEQEGSVELECNTTLAGNVSWKGSPPQAELERLGAHRLRVLKLRAPDAGNYSCWDGPRLLDSTFLAVRGRPSQLFHPGVTCQAESCDGSFTCAWDTLRPAAFRVRVCRRGQQQDPRDCPAREVTTASKGRVSILLQDGSFCCFAEEPEAPLELRLEAVSEDGSYEDLALELFLRDIVKPASPHRLAARRERGEKLLLSWAPPASWARPSLRYHLQLTTFTEKVEDLYSVGEAPGIHPGQEAFTTRADPLPGPFPQLGLELLGCLGQPAVRLALGPRREPPPPPSPSPVSSSSSSSSPFSGVDSAALASPWALPSVERGSDSHLGDDLWKSGGALPLLRQPQRGAQSSPELPATRHPIPAASGVQKGRHCGD
ncbi:interleukin-12 subunit beta-like [Hemicordylus capensis]|uniref:interleukin-12 subunit beta-like n=1 Tax=Hemicordylus capensis TaxID=884348 RepID=UPI002304B11E|nr:interleukin-12 subunit beta-like [Hemicordylus capensis]